MNKINDNILFNDNKNIKLPNNDEFNGSLFIELGDNKFGQFSSIYNDYFYIVDINNKNIELIKFDN